MKPIIVLFLMVLSFVCEGQTTKVEYYQDINYKDLVELKGLLYLKADTTLVTGRVIRYNRKNEEKRYILVVNGKPDKSGWIDINNDIKFIEPLTSKPIFSKFSYLEWNSKSYPYELNRKRLNDEMDRNRLEKDNSISHDVEKDGIYKGENDGLWEEWHENGQVKRRGILIEGKKDGLWENYHVNGKLESKLNYIVGIKDGLYEEYYYNGQLEIRVNYINGKKDGSWVEYYENGQLWSQGNYSNGRKTGKWKYFDEKGELLGTENYD